ncbi:MAG: hypothetical protein ACLQBJ_18300 [Bryobacteraceae bacterium]
MRRRVVPADFWPWLYFDNPAGDALAVVAFHGPRPVGRFECVPVRLVVDGAAQTAYLLQGLTLAPGFRQWAHLRGLLSAAQQAPSRVDPVFSFGFTTPAGTRLHASLGLPVLGRVSMFAAALDGAALLRSRGLPSALSAFAGPLTGALMRWKQARPNAAVAVGEIEAFTSDFDDLATPPSAPGSIGLLKDAAYLDWRYVRRPGACYHRLIASRSGQPAGLLVWRADIGTCDGYLLELAARDDDPATLDALLEAACEQMRSARVGLVAASFPRGSTAARALTRAGFTGLYTRWKKMSLAYVPGREGEDQAGMSLAHWSYSLGDWLYH